MPTRLLESDPADTRLLSLVRPPGHVNPTPPSRYDLVVVGAGAAGLVTAGGAGALGARVALVEKSLLGGDCLTAGCVPSKTLLSEAKAAKASGRSPDFAGVMAKVRAVRASLAPADSVARFQSEFGADVYLGHATFTGPDTLEVGGQTLRFRRGVLATGSRPAMPDVPGLSACDPLTNETVFALTELPPTQAIVGAGAVGCELAQAFARLGSRVTLIAKDERVLAREDPEASRRLLASLEADGVTVLRSAKLTRAEPTPVGSRLAVEVGGTTQVVEAARVLVAAGRSPVVEGFGLDRAGVEVDPKRGVVADDYLRTSNPRIFVAGDAIAGGLKFTHAAGASAQIALRNALFFGRSRRDRLVVPWCTFTDPEVARIGLTLAEAKAKGVAVAEQSLDWATLDRAATESAPGWCQVLTDSRGFIVGAAVVGRCAGELIGTVSLAMTQGLKLSAFAATVFPYPTYTEALRKLAEQAQKRRLTPGAKLGLGAVLRLRRGLG